MANHYQELAAQCILRAKEIKAPETKAFLLMMAEAWIKLAARHEQMRSPATKAIERIRIAREQTR
jgi:hypothetical protein